MAPRKPKKDTEAEVLEVIAAMSDADRRLAERLHALVRATAPELVPRLWYGQPAYAWGGDVVVFFRGADHDAERYSTLGFTKHAALDDGNLWPTSYALTELGPDEEARVAELVKAALG